jgi:hypothetical protein
MEGKTLAEIAFDVYLQDADDPWKDIADAVVAAHEARRWQAWPDGTNDDTAEYPPDEKDVLIYCGNWAYKDVVLGKISRRCGVYGPSGATHWAAIPAPPQEVERA